MMAWIRSKKWISGILFLCVIAVLFHTLTGWIVPKDTLQDGEWGHTTAFHHFYQMKKDTVDVLFLGSSIGVTDFCPQELYNYKGIRGYNLSSTSQSLFLSYWWLKEALRYQSPKVVVVDLHFLFDVMPQFEVNMDEGMIRYGLDAMKLSKVKMEAISDICAKDPAQSKPGYYLKLDRYHTRWPQLNEADFEPIEVPHQELKGYMPMYAPGKDEFETFVHDTQTAYQTDVNKSGYEYLMKIGELSKENNIRLLCVSLPFHYSMNDGMYNTCMDAAIKCGADYIDFDEKSIYESMDIKMPKENIVGHGNLWGAMKLAHFFGDYLEEHYGLEGQNDPQWEDSKAYFERVKQNGWLATEDDIYRYMEGIKDDSYSIMMMLGIPLEENALSIMSPKLRKSIQALGFAADEKFAEGEGYYFVRTPEDGFREEAYRDLTITGNLRNYCKLYNMECVFFGSPGDTEMLLKIMIDDTNDAVGEKDGKGYRVSPIGINMVVYDNEIKKIATNASFYMDEDGKIKRYYFWE